MFAWSVLGGQRALYTIDAKHALLLLVLLGNGRLRGGLLDSELGQAPR